MGKIAFRDNGADPYVYIENSNTYSAAIGHDVSDSSKLKMVLQNTANATPSGTASWVMTSAGSRTLPQQPSFVASLATESSVSGDGTVHSIGSVAATTTVFSQGSGFNPGDGAGTPASFTAPVTGVYMFAISVTIDIDATGGDDMQIKLVSTGSPTTYDLMNLPTLNKVTNFFGDGGNIGFCGSCFIYMTAADVVTFTFTSNGGAKADSLISANNYIAGALYS